MGSDQAFCSTPPGSRTQNLRIKSPAQPVRPVLHSPQNRRFVRIIVQEVLPNPPQSGEFVAKLVARLRPACGTLIGRDGVVAVASFTIVMNIRKPNRTASTFLSLGAADRLAIAGELLAAMRRTLW